MEISNEFKLEGKRNIYKILQNMSIIIFLFAYFIINYLFLTKYPFMHSDESWLSGLSRNIMSTGSLSVTETFFDLYPRKPHAIKIIFHILQTVFIGVFGYNLLAVRLISLIFSVLSLYMIYRIVYRMSNSWILAFFSLILVSLDVQYIYISHLARQEIILVFIALLAVDYYLKNNGEFNVIVASNLAIIVGIGVGIHPNFLIIFISIALILLVDAVRKKISRRQFFVFIGAVGAIGFIFLFLSLSFNNNFVKDYSAYGSTLGVADSLLDRLVNFKNYYIKLFRGITGTYYLPNIKIQLWGFAIIPVISLIFMIVKRKISYGFTGFIGVNVGYFIIGRYGQPSIIFALIFLYIALFEIICSINNLQYNIGKVIKVILLMFLIFVVGWFSIVQVYKNSNDDYDKYINEVATVLPKNSKVLANLNLEYYFDNGKLKDYRNLQYLYVNNLTFEKYIELNEIDYIVYPEEMDYIYRNSPKWDILYGNIILYYMDMQRFIDSNCEVIKKFESSYGMRIFQEMYMVPWEITIYKIKR